MVEVGWWTATAHEVGHTYGLCHVPDLVHCPDQTTEPISGYWVDQQRSTDSGTFFDLMGPNTAAYENLFKAWPARWEYERLFNAQLVNPLDPQVMIVAGTIGKDGTVKLKPLRLFSDGIASQTDSESDGLIQASNSDGALIAQASFSTSFELIGDDGTLIQTDISPFLIQLPIAKGADTLSISRNGAQMATIQLNSQLLVDAINAIPNQGFIKNPAQLRNSLLNKVKVFSDILSSGSKTAALNKLQNDIRKSIADWVLDTYPTSSPVQVTKSQVLASIDFIIAHLQKQ